MAAGERWDVGSAIEIGFATRPTACFLFSSAELVPALLSSSKELIDAFTRCLELVAVAAVTLVGGLSAVELVARCVGGLLRPLPVVPRDAEDAVDMVAGFCVVPAVRLAVTKGRLGGIPFRLGEPGVVWRSSFILTVSSLFGRSSLNGNLSRFSCDDAIVTQRLRSRRMSFLVLIENRDECNGVSVPLAILVEGEALDAARISTSAIRQIGIRRSRKGTSGPIQVDTPLTNDDTSSGVIVLGWWK